MTNEEREEALAIMNVIIHMIEKQYDNDRVEKAVDTAIAALKAEPCDRLKLDGMLEDAYEHGYQQARYDYETQPCEDAVKRESVLNTLDTMDKALDENRTVEAYKELLKECYKALPPATPKQRTGKWIEKDEWKDIVNGFEEWGYFHACSECGYVFKFLEIDNFCPNCGAKMEGE